MSVALVAALQETLEATRIETHISWVLLAGDDAWKIKKPVRFGFLDFASLETRRHMCEEELRLNRRLAPSVYLAVVPITGTVALPVLGGVGEPIEYALHMRRFASGALLSERLSLGQLAPDEIDALARRLAAFHHSAPVATAETEFGTPQRIASDMAHVLDGLAERGADVSSLRARADVEATRLASAFAQRKAGRFVREGHGDLHLANTLVLDGEVTAFDCIEFDPALRWIDVMADIAFVIMDLVAHERADLAWRFLDRYLTECGDYGGLEVLRFYLVYRAGVRALVARIRAGSGVAAAPDYLALAARLAQPGPSARPTLLITHGLSGSGKSHAAAALLEAAGAVRLRADVERKRLFGLTALASSASAAAGGIYTKAANDRTYARLAELAALALHAGWPVIVDAAFLRQHEREAFAALARREVVPFTILHCQASIALLEQRLRERAQRADDPSEADAAVLHRQLEFEEPLGSHELEHTIVLDAAKPLDAQALAARWLAQR